MGTRSTVGAGIKGLFGAMGRGFEFMSHWNTVGDLIRALFGHDPGAESKSGAAKGLYGLFGMKDEKLWITLLARLRPVDEEVIVDFIDWQMPRRTVVEMVVAAYYGNKFRVFTTTLGTDEQKLEFLMRMVDAFWRAHNAGYPRNVCHENIRYHLVRRHVPLPPERFADRLQEALSGLPPAVVNAYTYLRDNVEDAAIATNAEATRLEQEAEASRTHSFVNLFNWLK